jgi:hypothetical protein
VIFDDCPPEYPIMFKKYLPEDADYILTDVRNNGQTFGKQMDILLNQNYSERIYFAEDDYFYLPDCFDKMIDVIDNEGVDFVSPYDHLDLYTSEFHFQPYNVKIINSLHWRNCASTTMTFYTTKSTLKQVEHTFRTYINRNYDSSLWMSLTKKNINNPIRFLKLLKFGKPAFMIFAKAWYFNLFQIIFGKKYNLFTPIPSLAQHLDNQCMAPAIDWDKQFEEGKKWLIK